jgi:colicin import membrane protein
MMGTLAVHLAVLAVLLIFGFSVPPPPETEEGILVNFGTDETGSGLIEPSPPAVQEETSPPLPSETAVKSDEEPLLTQNTEEAPAVKKVDPEAEKKRLEQIETNKKRREELEAERIRKVQEETERKRIEAEQQRQTDIANRTKNALANYKNAGTTSTSEGVTGGQGNQGVPTGQVDSQNRGEGSGLGNKGVSYDLGGRGVTKLLEPKYDYQEEGKVVVEISVDRSGKVTQAIPGVKGSTTLNESLLRIAKEAALGTTFKPDQNAPLFQKGSIIYTFKLN